MKNVKISLSGEGTIADVNMLFINFRLFYSELHKHELFCHVKEIEDGVDMHSFDICFEGSWDGDKSALFQLLQSSNGLQSDTTIKNLHCEIFTDGKWYGKHSPKED